MWPFRKPPPVVEFSETSFILWLQAHCPQPLIWFVSQPLEHQEAMAELGASQTRVNAIVAGYAIQDPAGSEMGTAAVDGDLGAEEALAMKVAYGCLDRFVRRAQDRLGAKPEPEALTMAGFGERRAKAQQEAQT